MIAIRIIFLVKLKNDTNLEIIFKEKKNKMDVSNLVPEKYKTIYTFAHVLLTIFASPYFCEISCTKMKYAKNIYRNQLTDLNLDDLLRVRCSNYKLFCLK